MAGWGTASVDVGAGLGSDPDSAVTWGHHLGCCRGGEGLLLGRRACLRPHLGRSRLQGLDIYCREGGVMNFGVGSDGGVQWGLIQTALPVKATILAAVRGGGRAPAWPQSLPSSLLGPQQASGNLYLRQGGWGKAQTMLSVGAEWGLM